jgi:hypothetical protein
MQSRFLPFPIGADGLVIEIWKTRRSMLAVSTLGWVGIGAAAVILVVYIGLKLKQQYL